MVSSEQLSTMTMENDDKVMLLNVAKKKHRRHKSADTNIEVKKKKKAKIKNQFIQRSC